MLAFLALMLILGFIISNIYFNTSLYNIHILGGLIVLTISIFLFCTNYIFDNFRRTKRLRRFKRNFFTILTIIMPISGILMILFKGFSVNILGVLRIPSFYKSYLASNISNQVHTFVGIALALFVSSYLIKLCSRLVAKKLSFNRVRK